ncbi:MAG: DNA translocase FtsK, partial [Clostridiales bacterium]|nr:DNA translocase FtsK [Clostridiales bacterium]
AAMNEPRPVRYIDTNEQNSQDTGYHSSAKESPKQAYTFKRARRRFNPDVKIDEGEPGGNESLVDLDAYQAASNEETAASHNSGVVDKVNETLQPVNKASPLAKGIDDIANRELDLNEIFANPSDIEMIKRYSQDNKTGADQTAELEISVEKHRILEFKPEPTPVVKPAAPPPAPVYQFPPIGLLTPATSPRNAEAASELQENAVKLVETLASFNVRTKIVSVSRGPTITRYELSPEAGTRVRSIANLVDDIALSLATSGIRIETPIPGKAAVGVEVPNKVVTIVRLRELIDSDLFRKSQSKITACLGVDVAGAPIIVDLAKMPHLLIAGATGMGKSVCMNSIIVSLLYKATPDEVKLILVDPKKVELNIYNGIPHLLVPVVTDPKKAAGALHWAVTEMERRFELIEQAGVRNIQNYNKIVRKSGGSMEYMPQIVILIDELADLMMTAPDAVEESINRLAQKARAAGMHLILGTQRPSVDVITGLIKANIPSRIAFTVASQVDSRTIIDIAGAEKLIGRGDMLYAPVGSSKPIRVQGSYVSEAEVEVVAEFLKSNVGMSEYNNEVIESIEREAARCTQGKRGASSFGETGGEEATDPMLRPAIELAIESGKISTSLIQRRLSLGYGRAAKIIDKLEQLGYVSPPDGQKPRDVLITKQQYMEMVVRDEDIG